jgi:hypothetical protein
MKRSAAGVHFEAHFITSRVYRSRRSNISKLIVGCVFGQNGADLKQCGGWSGVPQGCTLRPIIIHNNLEESQNCSYQV